MIEYLEGAKAQGENFKCMLWGTVYANLPVIGNRSAASILMLFSPAPGVSGMINNAFCYIGLTERTLYVIALDAYDTSRILGTFALPLAGITSLKTRKTPLGPHVVVIECGEYVKLSIKNTSLGTNIKDQKERAEEFLAEMELLKERVSG